MSVAGTMHAGLNIIRVLNCYPTDFVYISAGLYFATTSVPD